jgi:hypothetical protein
MECYWRVHITLLILFNSAFLAAQGRLYAIEWKADWNLIYLIMFLNMFRLDSVGWLVNELEIMWEVSMVI